MGDADVSGSLLVGTDEGDVPAVVAAGATLAGTVVPVVVGVVEVVAVVAVVGSVTAMVLVDAPGGSSDELPPEAAKAAPPDRATTAAVAVMTRVVRRCILSSVGGGRSERTRRSGPRGLAVPGSVPRALCQGEAMTIHYAVEGAVATVTIDRPERRNAVDREHAEELAAAFRRFDADDRLSVAVLTGAGGVFCAGADLKGVAEGRGNRMAPDGDGPMGPTRLELTKPVIAAIEGPAVAGGLELAVWCDLRVAARGAVLGVYCRRWGVPLVDGGTFRLPRLIGQSRALDLILTGRGVPADEALDMGLVNRVVPDGLALAEAVALAGQIAAFPQLCVRSDLRSARRQWGLDEPAALLQEHELGMATIVSGETLQGAARFAAGAGRHGEGV